MPLGKPHLSIITLNENELNSPIKKHRVVEQIKKKKQTTKKNQDISIYMLLQETHSRFKGIYKLKMKGWKNTFLINGNQKISEATDT